MIRNLPTKVRVRGEHAGEGEKPSLATASTRGHEPTPIEILNQIKDDINQWDKRMSARNQADKVT